MSGPKPEAAPRLQRWELEYNCSGRGGGESCKLVTVEFYPGDDPASDREWINAKDVAALEDEAAKLRAEVAELRGIAQAVSNYMAESDGIAGWNLNGCIEPWAATELPVMVEDYHEKHPLPGPEARDDV